jgi:predicted 3-demethylubiquinone-9 3-methyltransferase (glyoxalase superfamily)
MTTDQKITPFLWFANDAEAAVAFYLEVFGGKEISRFLYPEGVESIKHLIWLLSEVFK